eukprot:scaffold1690_cov247-Pinguiococcus_pyrenoidosus.AAC.7
MIGMRPPKDPKNLMRPLVCGEACEPDRYIAIRLALGHIRVASELERRSGFKQLLKRRPLTCRRWPVVVLAMKKAALGFCVSALADAPAAAKSITAGLAAGHRTFRTGGAARGGAAEALLGRLLTDFDVRDASIRSRVTMDPASVQADVTQACERLGQERSAAESGAKKPSALARASFWQS